jgi:Na+/H+ antiporter NhaD/arsenite permease-like protein
MFFPLVVLLVVFCLIAVRQVGRIKLAIWQVMLLGAAAVLFAGQITPSSAINSINFDVILFLFGMFIVGEALDESGLLAYMSYKAFKRAKNLNQLMLFVIFGIGLSSAFLMNDTLAIIGTPVILALSKKHGITPKPLLLALAFAVTIGSVLSPIGNPQNLLIAVNSNMTTPFVTFLKYLLIPTIINLFIAYLLLKTFYRGSFHNRALNHVEEPIKDQNLALLTKISLTLVILLIASKIAIVSFGMDFDFKLTYIALLAAMPIMVLSSKRLEILRKIDWHTLIFFLAMFIMMESVWETGYFQSEINGMSFRITTTPMILAVSVTLSQLISNVPLVALYLPMLIPAGVQTKGLMALAAGSTIAGNLTILGAASNIIIIQNAEKKSSETITFKEFVKIGIPLTLINTLVYWLFLL